MDIIARQVVILETWLVKIRLPRGTEARNEYAETIGRDGMKILEAIYDNSTTPLWLQKIPAIKNLRLTWIHQYWIDNGQLTAICDFMR
jgi:transposase